MKQGQDRTKFDLGKISSCLEILPCSPPPSSLESEAGCCQLPWELQETMASTENGWSHLWLWQTLFPSFSSFGDSVRNKPSVSELYKISVFLFLTSLSVAKVAHPGVAKIHFCLHSWQEYFWFFLALLSWTSFSHWHVTGPRTAIQRFSFQSSKHSVMTVWSPRLHWLTATHIFSTLPDLFSHFVMVIT